MRYIVARQPIFEENDRLFAYELLFRSSLANIFPEDVDASKATLSLLSESYSSLGINTITGGNLAFVNFTRSLLLENFVDLFPRDSLVVEILEDVVGDYDLIKALKHIRGNGFKVALDDFTGRANQEMLTDHADIIKVDFLQTSREEQQSFVNRFKPRGIRMLAEKVETHEDLEAAKAMGYDLFQGYYFCRPMLIKGARIPENKVNKITLLKLVNQEEIDFDAVEQVVKSDVDLSYRLLKYMNSALFALRAKATDIKQSLVILGQKSLRRWACLLALTCLGQDKPSELLSTSLVRARLCELIAEHVKMKDRSEELFLMGMFSSLDALLDMEMEDALADIPLSEDLKSALLGEEGLLRDLLDFAVGYESGNWVLFESMRRKFQFHEDLVAGFHLDAMKTADEVMSAGID